MIPLSPLHEVLRLRSDTESPLRSDEVEITLDRDGKVLRGLSRMLRAHRAYVVRPGHEIEFKLETPLRDFEHNASVTVPYRCRVTVTSSAEAVALKAWHRELTPWETVQEHVRQASNEWWRQKGTRLGLPLKVALYQNRQALAGAVAQALQDAGFTAEVIAEITEDWDAPPLPLPNLHISVRLSDYVDREFDLGLDLELEVVPVTGMPDPRHPKTHAEWSDRVRDCVRKTALESITLECYHHDRSSLEGLIKTAIDTDIARFGRQCNWLKIETEKPTYKQHCQMDVRFTWEALHGRTVDFNARLEASILPGGSPVYLRHGAPDFETWFRQNLPEMTRRMLLTCDYTVLTPDYVKKLERKIEQEISASAAKIGIKVEALVLQNMLSEWRYLKPFDVDVPPETYQSSVADLPIRLDMSIHGYFDGLEELKGLTYPKDIVEAEVARVAKAAAATVARDITMDEYLNGWERRDEQTMKMGVRERIESEVEKSLASRLNMRVTSIKPRQHDNDLIQYVRTFERAKDIELQNFEFKPYDLHLQSARLALNAKIRIGSMTPTLAHQLKQKDIQPPDMEKDLLQWLTGILTSTETSKFKQAIADKNPTLQVEIENELNNKAMKHYGVSISLTHLCVLQSLPLESTGDTSALIKNERDFACLKNILAQFDFETQRILSDIEHSDTLTEAARKGELEQMTALQDSLSKLIKQGVAEGGEDVQKIQAKINELERRTGVRPALAPLSFTMGPLRQIASDPPLSAAQGKQQTKAPDQPDPDIY